MTNSKHTLCIISGPSGSGKTSIATQLHKRLTLKKMNKDGVLISPLKYHSTTIVLHQDNYFTLPFLSYNERKDDLYESDVGIDWDRLIVDIQSLASKHPSTLVIVEGHLLGTASKLFQSLFDSFDILAVLINCGKQTCLDRRLQRKIRNADDSRELKKYYENFVWPSFLKYGIDSLNSLQMLCRVAPGTEVNTTEKGRYLLEIDTDNYCLDDCVAKILVGINEI
jgi:uridine kinase